MMALVTESSPIRPSFDLDLGEFRQRPPFRRVTLAVFDPHRFRGSAHLSAEPGREGLRDFQRGQDRRCDKANRGVRAGAASFAAGRSPPSQSGLL